MTRIINCKEVIEAMKPAISSDVESLRSKGCIPSLTLIRIGEKPDDIVYENSITSTAEELGIKIQSRVYQDGIKQNDLVGAINSCNIDPTIHGILLLRPLPSYLDEEAVRNAIAPPKDVDGITDVSMANLYYTCDYDDIFKGFPPCTAEAVIDVLDYLKINLSGKNIAVVGRSTVIGKPVALLLLERNATVTVCHTSTIEMQEITKKADIVIVAAGIGKEGRSKRLGADYFSPGQIVLDVGINSDEDGIYGDVDTKAVSEIVDVITPVPGGIGMITTFSLLKHVIRSAYYVKAIPQGIKERWQY